MVKLLALLFVALGLEAIGVVYLSQGLHEVGELKQVTPAEVLRLVGRGATNGRLWLGMAMETVFFVLLLVMLRRWDVSLIWPLTSLGFVLTTLAAKFIRHEDVSIVRWGGVVLIVIGAVLVGYSETLKPPAAAGPPASPAFSKESPS